MTLTELARAVAFSFQSLGRQRLLEEELVRYISHDRRWLAPSKARAAVAAAREQGILRQAGAHAVELGREFEDLRLGIDFRPEEAALEASLTEAGAPTQDPSLFRRLVRAISDATQESESAVVARINEAQRAAGNLLRAEAAALVVARLHEIPIEGFAREVEASLQVEPKA